MHKFRSKRFAIGTALAFDLSDPWVIVGLLVGGAMPFVFASFCMSAVGKAGKAVVEEVRRQFREKPGIMEGTDRPEYGTCVDIVTRTALREMLVPAAIPIVIPIIVGLFGMVMVDLYDSNDTLETSTYEVTQAVAQASFKFTPTTGGIFSGQPDLANPGPAAGHPLHRPRLRQPVNLRPKAAAVILPPWSRGDRSTRGRPV